MPSDCKSTRDRTSNKHDDEQSQQLRFLTGYQHAWVDGRGTHKRWMHLTTDAGRSNHWRWQFGHEIAEDSENHSNWRRSLHSAFDRRKVSSYIHSFHRHIAVAEFNLVRNSFIQEHITIKPGWSKRQTQGAGNGQHQAEIWSGGHIQTIDDQRHWISSQQDRITKPSERN